MAGFNTAVTGLKSATTLLDVAGNNIANSSTVGFKSSRTEFGDIYATAVVGAGSSNTPGSGVTVTDIAQDFSGGTIEFTNSNLDLAINGSGFFQLDDGNGNVSYTRAGAFELNKDGFIVSKNGKYLQGYGLDAQGNQLPIQDLSVSQKESPPKSTETIDLSFNINSNEDAETLDRVFDKTNPNSYSYSTTIGTYDSLGNENSVRFYFSEQAAVREVHRYNLNDSDGSVQSTVSIPLVDGAGVSPLDAGDEITINNITFRNTTGSSMTAAQVSAAFDGLDTSTVTATFAAPTSGVGEVAFASGTASTYAGTFTDVGGTLTFVTDQSVDTSNMTPSLNNISGNSTVALGGEIDVDLDLTNVTFGGLNVSTLSELGTGTPAANTIYFNDTDPGNVSGPWVLADGTPDSQTLMAQTDPRIDVSTLTLSSTGRLDFEVKAQYTEYGDFAVQVDGTPATNQLTGENAERPANEVQAFSLNSEGTNVGVDPFTFGPNEDQLSAGANYVVNIGDIQISLASTLTKEGAIEVIESFEQELLDANPDLESFGFNPDTNQFELVWKASAGDREDDEINVTVTLADGSVATDSPIEGSDGSTGRVPLETVQNGDNSYIGEYRMYAFLNDDTQLNIGREPAPGTGTGADNETEVGPILISFDSTTGVLQTVNGEEVRGDRTPNITILGADPANPNDEILDSDIDNLKGIQLDISGSSQFASESIVKSQAQDGYPKGDLIGVTFSETGQMVASFSNGQRANLGLVAVATFENQDGLQPSGNTEWVATLASGNAIMNPPGTGLNGTLRSAALEQSNVDLSAELVKLIEGQRNFQANSKTLETLNTVTQAILQI
ncbi:MAG: flagellar biosynthesis protein FlgE [Oceanospirillaceae bacterium]|nr:flagellar biosynthesis protein FlgE [Oceanospirillaceae bacterium]